jgi:uncharacterized lipoprotein YajG
MTKDYFKRANVVCMTSWDLNCRSVVAHTPARNRFEQVIRRHARRSLKQELKKVLDNDFEV